MYDVHGQNRTRNIFSDCLTYESETIISHIFWIQQGSFLFSFRTTVQARFFCLLNMYYDTNLYNTADGKRVFPSFLPACGLPDTEDFNHVILVGTEGSRRGFERSPREQSTKGPEADTTD